MEMTGTLAVGGLAFLATLLAVWRSSRPRKDSHKPSWISWRLVTIITGAVVLLAVVHAVNLAGLHTGGNSPTYGLARP